MRKSTPKSAKSRWSVPNSSEKNERMEALVLHLRATFSKVQVKISYIDMAQIADPSNTPKCPMPMDKTRQPRVCLARLACREWVEEEVASYNNSNHSSSRWATNNNLAKTLTMVDSKIAQALTSHLNKSFLVTTLLPLQWTLFRLH